MLLTLTNLFPRPDQPMRGLFNAQLFDAAAVEMARREDTAGKGAVPSTGPITNLVFVPEWRLWRWAAIRKWRRSEIGSPGSQTGGHRQGVSTQYVPVMHIPVVGRNLAWRFHVQALRRYGQLFEQADAILATWLYPDAVAAGIVAREHGKPFWIKPHGTDRFHFEHPARGRVVRAMVKDAAGFIPNAQFLADCLKEHEIPTDKIHVIRHGIDHTRFHPRPRDEAQEALAQQKPGAISDLSFHPSSLPHIILYVGHLKPIKGPDRLVDAFADIAETAETQPQLLFIGSGYMRQGLEKRALDRGILDRVHFGGSRSPDEVALWMNMAHCLCLPSQSEGMPNVVIEALASGCPVVATDVGDVKQLVRDGVNGYIVKNDGAVVEGLSHALKVALSHEWNAADISATTADLSWSNAARQLAGLLSGNKPG